MNRLVLVHVGGQTPLEAWPWRCGHTMLELVMAMGAASILLAGLGSSVLITSRALRPQLASQQAIPETIDASQLLLRNIRLATGFTERTSTTLAFSVPDRDADGRPEQLRYSWSGDVGDPLMLSYNGQPPFPVTVGLENCDLTFMTAPLAGLDLPFEQTGSALLLLVQDSQNPTATELSQKSLIESWDFVVSMLGANDGSQAIVQGARNAGLVYIASSFTTKDQTIIDEIAGLSSGVIIESQTLIDEFGFAPEASTSYTLSLRKDITSGSHYITLPLSLEDNLVFLLPQPALQIDSGLADEANTLATVSGKPALVTLDPGSLGHDGKEVEGRRVVLPWSSSQVDPLLVNNVGTELIRRCIEWASGIGESSMEIQQFGFNEVFAEVTTGSQMQLATRVTLNEPGRLLAIAAHIGGNLQSTRFAIYADGGGGPGELLTQSAAARTSLSVRWMTLDTPHIDLPPGNYWLAVALSGSQTLSENNTTSSSLNATLAYPAVDAGFAPVWGSGALTPGQRSIYAIYEVPP